MNTSDTSPKSITVESNTSEVGTVPTEPNASIQEIIFKILTYQFNLICTRSVYKVILDFVYIY